MTDNILGLLKRARKFVLTDSSEEDLGGLYLDLDAAIERLERATIAEGGADKCHVCGGSGKIGQMGADNTDIFEIDCHYCHPEADDD